MIMTEDEILDYAELTYSHYFDLKKRPYKWSKMGEETAFEIIKRALHSERLASEMLSIWGSASLGQVQITRAWLRVPGIDVNAIDHRYGTALHAAVNGNSVEVVQALLAMPGIDVTVKNKEGFTALVIATEKTAPLIIEALLAAQGFEANFEDFRDWHRELAAGAATGDITRVRYVLANIPWININFAVNNRTAMEWAARTPHPVVIQALLATPGIIVDENTIRTLAKATVTTGNIPLLEIMMARPDFGLNDQASGAAYYLVSAAKNGQYSLVQALLAVPGIDINTELYTGQTALLAATQNSHYRTAIALAAMPGVDVNAKPVNGPTWEYWDEYSGHTALMVAAKQGNLALVRMFLAVETIEINLTDGRGYTALMLAAYWGHPKVVRVLLAMPGIDVIKSSKYHPEKCNSEALSANYNALNSLYRDSYSALSLAKLAGHKEIVDALLALPVSAKFVHAELHKSLRAGWRPAFLKPEQKSAATPDKTYRFLRRILHPGSGMNSAVPVLSPHPNPFDMQHACWLEQKCIALSLGTCLASDVPFLLQSTIPLPAWCKSALAMAIALGFTAGHYRNAPAPIWQPLLQTRAWFAGLAYGKKKSRFDAIELHAGICHQLDSMGLWNSFLNTVEDLREWTADPDNGQLDKLTLLGCAARDGDLPVIKTLVAMGANVHLRSPNGDAPILVAAKTGQWAACAELLALDAMSVMVDRKGYPALYYIASAFAHSDTATPALAKLIRYLRLKNVRFDILAPNPDEKDREKNPTVLVSDILLSNPESWIRYGKVIYGINDDLLPALPMALAPQIQQPTPSKTQVHAMFQSVNAQATLAAWLDADPQHLHWRDPDNDQSLLHLATANQNVGLVRLLLDRGIACTHVDRAGQSAAQLLPADYMSSYTPAAGRIAALLR